MATRHAHDRDPDDETEPFSGRDCENCRQASVTKSSCFLAKRPQINGVAPFCAPPSAPDHNVSRARESHPRALAEPDVSCKRASTKLRRIQAAASSAAW